MKSNLINYAAAAVALGSVFRDEFFPGRFQLCSGVLSPYQTAGCFILGCVCIAVGWTKSQRARKASF